MAHIISGVAGLSCLLALVIREYRVDNNITWVSPAALSSFFPHNMYTYLLYTHVFLHICVFVYV